MSLRPRNLSPLFQAWLPLAVLATILALLVYVGIQQSMRLSANDVPQQLAEDTANTLGQGSGPVDVTSGQIDIAASLAPFIVIYDENGVPQTGTGRLHGQFPKLPSGVFEYARKNTDDRITWQPETGVRVASVVKHFNGSNSSGFVLAGQSLREVEKRENLLTFLVLGGWLTALLGTYATLKILAQAKEEHEPRKS